MKNLLLSALIGLFFSSCQPILRLALGVKKPKNETYASISEFCVQNKMDTSTLFVSAINWQTLKVKLKNNLPDDSLQSFRLPKILTFDNRGELITLNNPGKCTPGALAALEKITATQITASSQNSNLSAFFEHFEGKDHQKVNFESVKDSSDVYIAFFWPKFWPSKTMEFYRELETLVKNQQDVKMKILLFNCDSPETQTGASVKR